MKYDIVLNVFNHGLRTFWILIHSLVEMYENLASLLARLESAYSLIWGAQEILGKGGGETFSILW